MGPEKERVPPIALKRLDDLELAELEVPDQLDFLEQVARWVPDRPLQSHSQLDFGWPDRRQREVVR